MPKYRIGRHRMLLQRETKHMNDKQEKIMKKKLYKRAILVLNAVLGIKAEDIIKVYYERVDETDFRRHDYGFTTIVLHTKFKIRDKEIYDKYKLYESNPDKIPKISRRKERKV